jgi:hypothetical protein
MNRWRVISIACMLLLVTAVAVVGQQSNPKNDKKVIVTLVRWPYT